MELLERESTVWNLLTSGWVVVHTIKSEFRINNGPPEDMAIIERLLAAGYVIPSSDRAYIAAFCPWPYKAKG
jgi:hypothetical protein